MEFEKLRRLTYTVVLILSGAFLFYLFMKHVFVAVLPFLIGWFVAFAMRPVAAYLSPRLKIKQGILRLLLTILLIVILAGLVSVAIWLLSREVWSFLSGLDSNFDALRDMIGNIVGDGGIIGKIFGELGNYVADGIYSILASLLGTLGGAVSSLASMIPRALFFLLITVISAVYFSLDLDRINAGVKSLLPKGACSFLVRVKDGFLSALFRYARSYLLLLLITFGEMLVGLFILRAPYPVLMAIVVAVLDLLPVIGVGTVLIPWGIWALISGKGAFGIGLFALFLLHTVFRQIIEPRIVGKNLGIHPVLTLVFLYVGYTLFGFVGLIFVPLLTVLVNIAFGKKNTAEVSDSSVGESNDT